MITIKKYPNRRLYDTSKSQYVNMEAIKELVLGYKEFKVVDSKTDEDITKSILLQIITEQEANDHQALLTNSVLQQLIRFYGSDMQLMMRQYLEQSVFSFMERQDSFQEAMQEFISNGVTSPMTLFNQYIEKNLNMWQQFSGVKTPDQKSAPEADGSANDGKNGKND